MNAESYIRVKIANGDRTRGEIERKGGKWTDGRTDGEGRGAQNERGVSIRMQYSRVSKGGRSDRATGLTSR